MYMFLSFQPRRRGKLSQTRVLSALPVRPCKRNTFASFSQLLSVVTEREHSHTHARAQTHLSACVFTHYTCRAFRRLRSTTFEVSLHAIRTPFGRRSRSPYEDTVARQPETSQWKNSSYAYSLSIEHTQIPGDRERERESARLSHTFSLSSLLARQNSIH